jgi:hypothetical protein
LNREERFRDGQGVGHAQAYECEVTIA